VYKARILQLVDVRRYQATDEKKMGTDVQTVSNNNVKTTDFGNQTLVFSTRIGSQIL
jgi:hypothetical protein